MKIRILPLLGLLFTLAIIPRMVALANETIADNSTPPILPLAKQTSIPKSKSEHQSKLTKIATDCVSGDVLIEINKKMALLKRQEIDIKKRISAYNAIQVRLDKQMRAIKSAKASLQHDVNDRQSLAREDIIYLTQMYQTMKPKQAAKIFNEMDVRFAAGILREIKSAQAGLILSNMGSKKAYKISILIASKNSKYRQQ